MAGSSDIRAGRAYVELLLRDKGFAKGLSIAGAKLRSWGQGISMAGAAVTAAGAAIVTPLLGIVKSFTESGSALFDMVQRTNMSAKSLQELGYAAEQTGTSMEVIEKAINKARKEGKNFDQMAAQIASIQDPAKQSQKAIDLFGVKLGPQLVPMIRDLGQLRERFQKLGLGMSNEDAAAADSLGDAWADLMAVGKSASDAIGAVLAPHVQAATEAITQIAITVRDWIKENRQLFVTALKVGVAVMAAGAAITALGLGFTAAGVVVSGFGVAIGAVASAIGMIVSPIGLVVAGLAGLATWFATSTQYGREMVVALSGWFAELKSIAVDTFGGIADALAAGDLQLAAEIAWAGIKTVWLKGTDELRKTWIGFKNVFMQTTLDIVIGAASIWEKFTSRVESLFIGMRQRIMDSVFNIGAFMEKIGKSDAEKAAIDKVRDMGELANSIIAGAQQTEAEAATKQALDALAATKKAASETIDANTQKQLAESAAALKSAQEQLAALRGQAATARKDKELGKAPGFAPAAMPLAAEELKQKVFGTFSAAAFAAGGGGESTTVKELREQKKLQHDALKEAMRIRVAVEKSGVLRS